MARPTTKRRLLTLLGVLLAFALVAAACGDSDDDSSSSSDEDASSAEETESTDDAAEEESTDDAEEDSSGDSAAAGSDDTVRLGILGECEGTFGGFHEDVVAGAVLAMINNAGATSNSSTTALDGFSGAEVAGVPIELVSVGCGDDTPDRAIQEIRKIVEQDGANVVIGPLSGDESIAVANYAKDHPEVTFINGIAGAQETTLQVQAENFFRYNGDGAQWNAGIGDILYNDAGWRTAAVIATTTASAGRRLRGSSPTSAPWAARSCSGSSRRSKPPTTRHMSSSCPTPMRSTATSGSWAGPVRRPAWRRS